MIFHGFGSVRFLNSVLFDSVRTAYSILFGSIRFVFGVILSYFDIIFIFEEAGSYCARRGAGTSIFGTYFSKKTCIFTPYSTVPTSGIARRDPSRHVDVIIQILVKIRLM